MKGTRALVAVVIMLGLVLVSGGAALADPVGPYDVTYVGYQYDTPEDGQSTWYYTVTSTETCGAISHIVFGLEVCCSLVDAGAWTDTGLDSWWGTDMIDKVCDPTTRVCGIKFDEGFEDDPTGTRNYYFTVEGNHPEAENVIKVAVKTGSKCAQDEELLPSGGLLAGQYSMLASEAVLADGDPMTYEEFIDGPFVDCGTTAIALSSFSAASPVGLSASVLLVPAALLMAGVLLVGSVVLVGRQRRLEV